MSNKNDSQSIVSTQTPESAANCNRWSQISATRGDKWIGSQRRYHRVSSIHYQLSSCRKHPFLNNTVLRCNNSVGEKENYFYVNIIFCKIKRKIRVPTRNDNKISTTDFICKYEI